MSIFIALETFLEVKDVGVRQWNTIQPFKWKEVLTLAISWVKPEGIILTEASWLQRTDIIQFHLHESFVVVKL